MRSRSSNAWLEWHTGLPLWLGQVTLGSLIFALLYALGFDRKQISYFLTSLATILLIIFFQRSVGWRRVWFFFAPIYFSFSAAGIIYLLKNILKLKEKIIFVITALFIVFFSAATILWLQSPTQEMHDLRGGPETLERGILYLKDIIEPQDAILANADYTPQMQYYADYHGIPIDQTHPANNQFTSLYVILLPVDTALQETLHGGTTDRVDINASKLIFEDGDLKIYKVPIVVFYE